MKGRVKKVPKSHKSSRENRRSLPRILATGIPPDMASELQKFDQDAEQMIVSFVEGIEAQPRPPIIYHYTNDVGLKGIVESGKIWITDIFSLNDPSELSHGFSHAVNILKSKATDGPPESKTFSRLVEAFSTHGGIHAAAHYFVSSFSSNGDDLGQWRAYADNGRGYALGFDTAILENSFIKDSASPDWSNSTFSVIFKDSQLAGLHKLLVERMFHLISMPHGRNLASATMHAYMDDLLELFLLHALRAVLFFKHEAYKNEQEYRFLQVHRATTTPPVVQLRTRPYALVRYREFDWKTANAAALKNIVVGPAADNTTATQFARDCLRAFHPSDAEVVYSIIPYRSA